MKVKVLIADDDMDVHQLMSDVLEINFRDVQVERALTPQSFWAKAAVPEGEKPWQIVFLCVDYIKEEPDNFLGRLNEANPDAQAKLIITGYAQDFESCAEDIRQLPFLAKPFSLDTFEAMVKSVHS